MAVVLLSPHHAREGKIITGFITSEDRACDDDLKSVSDLDDYQ